MYSIREAGKNDIPLIRELCLQVWPQTYAAIISQEQIDFMLDMMYSEASLEKQMDDGAQFIFIEEENTAVGFASYGEIEPGIFKLHKIYVLPSQQGKGSGRFIIDHIKNEIKQRRARALRLQVNKHNKALYFYQKLGFRVIEELVLEIGNGYVMDDYLMELALVY